MNFWDHTEEIGKKIKEYKVKLLMLDFDGTLSPIAPTPEAAVMTDEMKDVLQNLSGKENLFLAIISGRQLQNVKEKVNIPGIIYVGNHGLEKEIFGEKTIFDLPVQTKEKLLEVKKDLGKIAEKYEKSWVEDKELVVTLHYRHINQSLVNHLEQELEKVTKKYTDIFSVTFGKKIIEVKPSVGVDKGTVVKELIEVIKEKTKSNPLAFYIGDDTTDEDAFKALQDGITIRVGSVEHSSAAYSLFDTEDVFNFLTWFAEKA